MSDTDIAYMPVAELLDRYRAKSVSPVEATRAALARIDGQDGKVNAFCHVDADGAMAAAREAEARWARGEPRGLIDGVPLGVKDTLHARGMPTRFGSRTTGEEPAEVDTSTTLACRNHGAVLLGKTTNPEFAIGPTTNSPLTGVTTNPWDPGTHAGGSTGGGAAAVAAGMGNTSLATDAGGSTRIPAALCGKVGFKATNHRVPAYPPPGMPSLSCPGAITHTVTDTALMMNVMTEPDPRDWLAAKPDGVDYLAGLDDGIKGLKVAYSATLNGHARFVDPEVAAAVAAAAAGFAELGATVEEADPDIESPIPILSAYLISRITHRVGAMTEAQREVLGPSIKAIVGRAENLTLMDMVAADEQRQALSQTLNRFLSDHDLLLTPTLTVPAFDAGRLTPVEFERFEDPRAWVPFCSPFNLSQQPAITVPCGFTAAGLPIALQIVGPRHEDTRVLRAARAYERLNPLWQRRVAHDPPASVETGLFTRYPWLPYALLVCAMAFYSMGFVVGRAIRDEVPPVGLVFWRAGLACALLLPLIHRQLAAQLPLLLHHWRLFLGLALTQSVLGQGLLFVSLHTTTAINVGLLQTLQPVFILFLVALLFGERIGLRQGVGTAVALLGVLVTIARGDLDVLLGLGFVPGDILILVGTASWSVYAILVKRSPALSPLVLFFGITAVGGALLLPLYLAETLLLGRAMPLSWSAAGAVGYVATINGIAALTLVNIGIIHLGPSRAGVFYYLIPVFGAVLAILLLGESFRAFHAAGMALVLLGVYLAGRAGAR